MSDYTADPTNNPVVYELPDDGDVKPVSSVNPTLEALADAAAHSNWPETNSAKSYPLATQTLFRVMQTQPVPIDVDNELAIPRQWGVNSAGFWCQTDITFTVAGSIDVPLDIPHGCTLKNVYVKVNGKTTTGHGALPGTMAKIRVFSVVVATGVSTAISALTTDTSANVAAYDVAHEIQAVVNVAVDRSAKHYIVRLLGENGANAVPGFQLLGVVAEFEVTNMDKGAA